MKILVVEDNPGILDILSIALVKEGFLVDAEETGTKAFTKAKSNKYDIIILDLMLPEKSGFEIIRSLRALRIDTPILVISAKNELEDRIRALNLGADDYLVKHFSVGELIARIKSIIRRSTGKSKNTMACDNLIIDLSEMSVRKGRNPIQLTRKEFTILLELLRNKNKIVTLTHLLEAAWGNGQKKQNSNCLNVHIRSLRKKIDDDSPKKLIHTVRGFGYRLGLEK